jgi:hypothetical protein
MDLENMSLQLEGLGKLDLLQIQSAFPAETRLETLDEREEAFGEPGTVIALIAAANLMLPALMLWLARKRWAFQSIKESKVTLPDGTQIESRVRLKLHKSGPPSAEQLKELAEMTDVDLSDAIEALSKTGLGS